MQTHLSCHGASRHPRRMKRDGIIKLSATEPAFSRRAAGEVPVPPPDVVPQPEPRKPPQEQPPEIIEPPFPRPSPDVIDPSRQGEHDAPPIREPIAPNTAAQVRSRLH